MKNIIFASNNSGKTTEIKQAFSENNINIRSLLEFQIPDVAETGLSFIENALIKARHAAKLTNLPAIADDSGLLVSALEGRPGLYSARYAGDTATDQDNIKKLLYEMQNIPHEQRQAYYYCALVFLASADDPTPVICQGKWQGSILFTPKGDKGFGYDPVFFVPTHQCSAAELDLSEKNRISHRGVALSKLKAQLISEFI